MVIKKQNVEALSGLLAKLQTIISDIGAEFTAYEGTDPENLAILAEAVSDLGSAGAKLQEVIDGINKLETIPEPKES